MSFKNTHVGSWQLFHGYKPKVHIENNVFVFDEFIVPKSTGNEAHWIYTGNPTDIVHIKPNCGCTGSPSMIGDKIIVSYNETNNFKTDANKIPNKNSDPIRNGYWKTTKSISVYLNDGKPLYSNENALKKQYNVNKAQYLLTFEVKVKVNNIK